MSDPDAATNLNRLARLLVPHRCTSCGARVTDPLPEASYKGRPAVLCPECSTPLIVIARTLERLGMDDS